MVREFLKKLIHARSVRDYFKEFGPLILDIKNVSKVDMLFNFKSSLSGWA